jgi:hypothetical protein
MTSVRKAKRSEHRPIRQHPVSLTQVDVQDGEFLVSDNRCGGDHPECWPLAEDPLATLREKDRRPTHVCVAMCERANRHWLTAQSPSNSFFQSLAGFQYLRAFSQSVPVGRKVLARRLTMGPRRPPKNILRLVEESAPFAEDEEALLVLRVSHEGSSCEAFFLANRLEHPTDPNADLLIRSKSVRFRSITGSGNAVIEQFQKDATAWWRVQIGLKPDERGRPKNPKLYAYEDAKEAYWFLMEETGSAPADKRVAERIAAVLDIEDIPRSTFSGDIKEWLARDLPWPPPRPCGSPHTIKNPKR